MEIKIGEITFFANHGRGYIFADVNGRKGTLGKQICRGGKLMGSCLEAKDFADFEKKCRSWIRAHKKQIEF